MVRERRVRAPSLPDVESCSVGNGYSARLTTTFTRLLHAFHAILHATILVDRRGFEPVTWSFC